MQREKENNKDFSSDFLFFKFLTINLFLRHSNYTFVYSMVKQQDVYQEILKESAGSQFNKYRQF